MKKKRWLCNIHPRYEAKNKPRSACEACWTMWFDYKRSTSYECKYCSFQPTSYDDYCSLHRTPRNMVFK